MAQRYFQWLAGDRRGEVVVFNDIVQEDGVDYITFKDNSRINADFVAEINQTSVDGKLMAEIENPRNTWGFKEVLPPDSKPRIEQDWESQIKYEVPPVEEIAHADGTAESLIAKPVPKKKKIELIPPRKTKNKFGKVATTDDLIEDTNDNIASQPKVEQKAPEASSVNSDDPVYIMMKKAKKVDTEVDMSLTISLPSKHLFDVVRDSFDEGDSKALEYIIENIDITDIKEALKAGIKSMYGENEDLENNKLEENEIQKIEQFHEDKPAPTEIFEPEVVEEPIVRDAKTDELDDLAKSLKEKSDKINQENE